MKTSSASYHELEIMEAGRTRLFLIRHGELTTSSEWRYVGHKDVGMNDTGINQIERLAVRLKEEKIDVVLSSDLIRSVKSAEIIGDMIGISPIQQSDFREINLGHWEGMTRDEIVRNFNAEFQIRDSNISAFRVEGGESFIDLKSRVIPKLNFYLDKYSGKNLLLVAHGGVNRVIICNALGLDLNNLTRLEQAYGCLNIIDFFNGISVVTLLNETNFGNT